MSTTTLVAISLALAACLLFVMLIAQPACGMDYDPTPCTEFKGQPLIEDRRPGK